VTRILQGDTRLLDTEIAQRMLASTELARVAYVALDGLPRVLPMLFHWNGTEIILCSFADTYKIPALRARPDVAITIDTTSSPPDVLLVRGQAAMSDFVGVIPEFLAAQIRYLGEKGAAARIAEIPPGTKMVRIAVRPSWVGVFDFRSRFPGGRTAEEMDTYHRDIVKQPKGTGARTGPIEEVA
jgi:hypothetical protein